MTTILSYLRSFIFLAAAAALLNASAIAGERKDTTKTIDFDTAFKTSLGNLTVAEVGDKKISAREFLCSYEYGPSFTKREKDSKKRYLNYLINEKLLALDGYSRGLEDSSQVKDLLSAIKSDITTELMFENDIQDKIEISKNAVDRGIAEKEITYRVKWLYAPNSDSLAFYMQSLRDGISFDSLFNMQIRDSVYADNRSMDKDKFKFRMENPQMFAVVDNEKAGFVSAPVKGPDGWYIIKLVNTWKNVITTETERDQQEHDVKSALTLAKSDSVSDVYVKKLMLENSPVIQGKAFDILRSYMGEFVLDKNKFNSWNLDERMKKELENFKTLKPEDYNTMKLVVLNTQSFTLSDFINWYRMRDEYIKFNENNFNSFSASLEQEIWQMVRDNLLTQQAYSRGYQNKEIIKDQLDWWQDKIVYAVVRDGIGKSIGLNVEKPSNSNNDYNEKKQDLITKTFRKLQELKKKYKVQINEDVLNRLVVEDSNNPRAVDFYFVRKGGIFPHPVYPSIDFVWHDWE